MSGQANIRVALTSALKELKRLQAQQAERSSGAIAIVSMACRIPGGVADPEQFWQVLADGNDLIGAFPARWDRLRLYDPDPEAQGKSYANQGGFIDDVEAFDATFFGISPLEARSMDPQQRLVLETAWEALERAGIVPADLAETQTGVYIGCTGSDYGASQTLADLDGYVGTGNLGSVVTGRLSYLLGLEGPSVTIDTACSSSLVAIHHACNSLRQGESDLVISGGVNVMSTPLWFVEFSRLNGLSVDARCKSFSEQANGAIWAEGCGILVLKRLADAKRDGDTVQALIRGSAVNQDGRSQGLSAPNGPSQQRVIRRALNNANLKPVDIDAIEAHGTGTDLGDPIEAGALSAVFKKGRETSQPVYLGSSKSNLGHSAASAGVIGLIKMVLALQYERLPQTLHADQPSSKIAWQGSGLQLLQQSREWPRGERVRRAGISSFGISGTNAHAIVEEAPAEMSALAKQAQRHLPARSWPIVLSGKSPASVRQQAQRWANWLQQQPEVELADVAYTASCCRSVFEQRASIAATTVEQAIVAFQQVADGSIEVVQSGQASTLAMLFTGQGSQRLGMGRELYQQFDGFRQALDEICVELDRHLSTPIKTVMFAGEVSGQNSGHDSAEAELLDQTAYTQPALFAIEVALYRQWQVWGVQPDFVAGHSIGELSAAHVAGVMNLADAARLVCARGRLMQACQSGGAMVSIEASEAELRGALAQRGGVDIAGLNGPRQTVLSGDEAAVCAVAADFAEQGRRTHRLQVSHAFHSPHMNSMLDEYRQIASSCQFQAPQIVLVSTVTGKVASATEMTSADYWTQQVRQAVRFTDALDTLVDQGVGTFLEVGPDAVLSALAAACVEPDIQLLPSLHKQHDDEQALMSAVGSLFSAGYALDWTAVLGQFVPVEGHVETAESSKVGNILQPLALPTYAFQRQHYWMQASENRDIDALGLNSAKHPLLGVITPLAGQDGYVFSGQMSLVDQPWLADHLVHGSILFPGTGLLELAQCAAQHLQMPISRLTLAEPLVLNADARVNLQLRVGELEDSGRRQFQLFSRLQGASDDVEWSEHANGSLSGHQRRSAVLEQAFSALQQWPPAADQALSLTGLYDRLAIKGLQYGSHFQGLQEVYRDAEGVYARVVLPETLLSQAGDYGIHPALMDAALHALDFVLADENDLASGIMLPFEWSDVVLMARGASELRVRLALNSATAGQQASVSLAIADANGEPVAAVGDLQIRRASAEQIKAATRAAGIRHLYRVEYQELVADAVTASEDGQSVSRFSKRFIVNADEVQAKRLRATHIADFAALKSAMASVSAAEPVQILVDLTAWQSSLTDAATDPLIASVHEQSEVALDWLQQWLADEVFEHSQLIWLTQQAVGTAKTAALGNLMQAPVWGLVRSARSENPLRQLRLIDLDQALSELHDAEQNLEAALAIDDEPELLWRDQQWLAPRLLHAGAKLHIPEASGFDPDGSVLLTGAFGELGRAVALHLVQQHGVKHLVLTSRKGDQAPGAPAFIEQLQQAGAVSVIAAACDMSSRDGVAKALQQVSEQHPLTAVLHMAGLIDDGIVSAQNAERLQRVMLPKVDGALYLHEMTQHLPLSAFVLFSSSSGIFGAPGQSNYAAANSFLDALAQYRLQQGLPATSMAWGLWAQAGSGMTADLSSADIARLRREGVAPMAVSEGLSMLDAGLFATDAALVPIRLDIPRMQKGLDEGTLSSSPALLRSLVRQGPAQVNQMDAEDDDLRTKLLALSDAERLPKIVQRVQQDVAAALGLSTVEAHQEVMQLGMDSLTAVTLRSRIGSWAGITLPATFAFDYGTPQAIAEMLNEIAFADDSAVGLADFSFDQDMQLPADVVPQIPVAESLQHTTGRVLVTGASGFLGAYLLGELINQTDLNLICLVRASDADSGLDRLYANLDRWQVSADLKGRVEVLCGDLEQPRAGLSEQEFANLAQRIDAIYHGAAFVNWVYEYQDLRAANVLGTIEMLRLACLRCLPFHYVSTVAVFNRYGTGMQESDKAEHPANLGYGYAQSKAVGDHLAWAAGERGLPVSIYRPALITGDYQTGATLHDDFLVLLMSGIAALGYAPKELNDGLGFPISPVHMFASSIRRIAANSIDASQIIDKAAVYHLVVDDDVSYTEQLDLLRARGFSIEMCDYAEWLQRLHDDLANGIANPLHVLINWMPQDSIGLIFDKPLGQYNALAAFDGPMGASRQADAFNHYLDYLLAQGLLKQPIL